MSNNENKMKLVSHTVLSFRQDIDSLEKKICVLEDSEKFNSENARYKRYINEKNTLQNHIIQLMASFVSSSENDVPCAFNGEDYFSTTLLRLPHFVLVKLSQNVKTTFATRIKLKPPH